MALLLLLGCAPPSAGDSALPADPSSLVTVVSSLAFAREDGNVADGLDLDGAVTAAGDTTGCGLADHVSPAGLPGVDNSMADLLPAIEERSGVAVDEYVPDAIHAGALLLALQLDGVDSVVDDPAVTLTLYRANGPPALGADGALEWWQTLAVDEEVPPVVLPEAAIVDGRLVAGPLDLPLPIQLFSASILLPVSGATLSVELGEDGAMRGVLAGGLDVATWDTTLGAAIRSEADLAFTREALGTGHDLLPDANGACSQVSVALQLLAIPGFLWK